MVKKINYQTGVNILLVILIVVNIWCYAVCDTPFSTDNLEIDENEDIKAENEKDTEETKKKVKNKVNKKAQNEEFLDWSMYNPPIVNGYTPRWWNKVMNNVGNNQQPVQNLDNVYNPLGYSNRSQAFYNQGWYPNMNMPPQVVGCGGRRMPCLGGTQETIPVINPPVEISERNIAPVNVLSVNPDATGVMRQVGVLYKIFGSLNEIYPLYGIKRYRNSDTWDYSTKVGEVGNFVHLKVLTKRLNNNELQTNDEVRIDGNSARFRVTMYDNDFPQYVPYIK